MTLTQAVTRLSARLPRTLHPGAWWVWALGLATAAGRTTNPLLLIMILAVAGYVVVSRRGNAPWALAFRMYLMFGAFIILMRVLFRIIFGGGQGETVLFTLPQIVLPELVAGIRLFGPVAAEQLLGGLYDGLRLATMLICLGAANALANPKRMLKAVPGALYEVGSAVVVALSVAPQLIESVHRVRRARRLRGGRQRGMRALRGIVIPVLADALDRSLLLAAAMDSRGYGRRGTASPRSRLLTGTLVLLGLSGVCVGVYGLLDGTTPRALGLPFLVGGLAIAATGFVIGGKRVQRSIYRPDHWHLPEILVAATGITAGALLFLTGAVDPANLYPSLNPLAWPELSVLPTLGVLIAVLPAWLSPPPPTTEQHR
ncbi:MULTISPECIES: energy-coupling factor transporter transmembrane protein EcfT [unclassified Crossiella]|uniref:energy-coupling factor transporter transmembrane protein EcfT n=1 Tax=unclassified Crossiella TaxID=2620835 RepID=UPI001FFEC927|nr:MULTISPECIES: energy-coupling factor transporter transmembrane protein EcfT [unclassified Crossiella]MCK2245086.1 energy-coupling factor transporter transmembrane protein EcfT [Crossiella sp. S99.2]MCK2258667.1 energy-coupling factor transporter transmembrane protein EcfT [Crossiella sp. S99.1]